MPSVAGPSSTPVLALASLNHTAIPLATSSHSCATVPTSTTVPVTGPAPVPPVVSAPAPPIQDDSQNVSATRNNAPPVPTVTTTPIDPPSHTVEAAAIAVTSESPAGPSTSVPNPAGNSDTQVDSRDAQTIPSTSEVPKTTSEKAPVKKTPKA